MVFPAAGLIGLRQDVQQKTGGVQPKRFIRFPKLVEGLGGFPVQIVKGDLEKRIPVVSGLPAQGLFHIGNDREIPMAVQVDGRQLRQDQPGNSRGHPEQVAAVTVVGSIPDSPVQYPVSGNC